MDRIVVSGGNKLNGNISISGAKNAAVAILPAALLASKGVCVIENVPEISDVKRLVKILEHFGAKVKVDGTTLEIDSTNITTTIASTDDVRKMRASYYFLGSLISRFKEGKVDLPGGCVIGVRPIDQHIKGFEALGADVEIEEGAVAVKVEKLEGTNIYFDVVSVGATINVMLSAVLAEGTTILENVAREPHVVDVANFLNSMGAKVKGAGTDIIKIEGVEELHGCNYSIIPDQIEAGTYMIAAAACGEKVTLENVIPKHLESISAKLIEMGVNVTEGDDSVTIEGHEGLKGINVKTLPYPGFPTDVQQPMGALLAVAGGRSTIKENIWESRFKYITELEKMGAKAQVDDRLAVIDGVSKLVGTEVEATDLRAGAALIVAGLMAEGDTIISNIEHIDRGYPNIEDKLRSLGAKIKRI